MSKLNKFMKHAILVVLLGTTVFTSSGCKLAWWALKDQFIAGWFWGTTPMIPVTPYMSQQIEDTYWNEERLPASADSRPHRG